MRPLVAMGLLLTTKYTKHTKKKQVVALDVCYDFVDDSPYTDVGTSFSQITLTGESRWTWLFKQA